MRRILSPSFALLAGLATLLAGCAGESPTREDHGGTGGTGTGTCNVDVQLAASSFEPFAGTAVVIRATVKRNGAAVPDGSSVRFTTDFGFFVETGLPSVSKVITSGVADVTLASTLDGPANVTAFFECGTRSTRITFGLLPVNEPFISSVAPTQGKCEGGDTVTIQGGNFDYEGNTAATTRVTFGGAPASIVSVTGDSIVVKTPARTLANPAVPERVDISVTVNVGRPSTRTVNWTVAEHNGFTYNCLGGIMSLTSLSPTSGPPDGGTVVKIVGTNFGTNIATTRVTFGGVAASITAMSDTSITVSTPRHPLANPAVPETVDVTVTKDLGLVSQQSATLFNAFTYRGTTTSCPPNPLVFISHVEPQQGSPNGGDVVTISGGGFGDNLATTRVEFGGLPAQVTSVTDNTIKVTTPRHILANPNTPETVNVVVTKDVGGPNCATATQANAFTYSNAGVLSIFSNSPVTGPNDVSTRVTIFGTGFVFPMQVFLTGGACGAQLVEAAVIEIQPDHIIFQTPIAANGNQCLANQLVSIRVVNPTTGDKADRPDAFKYYACPTAIAAVPEFGPYYQPTTVTITGQNFVEGAQAVWEASQGGVSGPTQLTVSSVSAAAIVVTLPVIDPLQSSTGGAVCSNIPGTITLKFPSLACTDALSVPFTYKVDAPQVSAVSPTEVPQAGGTTITVAGAFFNDPMTVVLLKNGVPITYTTINNANVANANQLTFIAPAIRDAEFNQQACVPTGGTSPIGSKYVPTSFGVRVTNARTGCSATAANLLTYLPQDTSCRVAAAISATTLPAAVICSSYSATVAGTGTGALSWSLSMPPGFTGLSIAPGSTTGTAVISGIPALSPAGPGVASGTFSVTVTLTDSSVPATTDTMTFPISFTDPSAPFTIVGSATATISGTTGGSSTPYTYTPAGATGVPINWTGTISATPAAGSISLTPASGASTAISVAAGTTAGTYTITLRGTDTGCGHTATLPVTLTVN